MKRGILEAKVWAEFALYLPHMGKSLPPEKFAEIKAEWDFLS